jgi:hypothetical protein
VERDGAGRSLHQLISDAIARGARLQAESRIAVDEVHESTVALERTLAAIRRQRVDRAGRRVRGPAQRS